jgi:hypothetical protein
LYLCKKERSRSFEKKEKDVERGESKEKTMCMEKKEKNRKLNKKCV